MEPGPLSAHNTHAHRDCLPHDDGQPCLPADKADAEDPLSAWDAARHGGVKSSPDPAMGSIETTEALAYLEFRAAAQALKACNTAAVAASERFRAALAKLSEAAAP